MGFGKTLKELLLFSEPGQRKEYILAENNYDKARNTVRGDEQPEDTGKNDAAEKEVMKSGSHRNEKLMPGSSKAAKNKKREQDYRHNEVPGPVVSSELDKSLKYMRNIFSIPQNGDMILREFSVNINNRQVEAFVLFYDGMTDRKLVNDNILQPLMLLSNMDIKTDEKDIVHYVRKHLLPQNQLTISNKYRKIIDLINFGGCGLFIEGCKYAFGADVKGWEHRNVERPNMELVIRGPQEGFNEVLRVNTALVRKIVKDENLVAEDVSVGKRGKTACSLMYIKDITNDSLVQEVRRRLKGINVDFLIDSGELEQYLEDHTFLPSPQMIATERPDRVAAALTEGKVAVIMNGSPNALIMPVTIGAFFHTPEDSYVRFSYANLFRLVRFFGIIFALFLPAIYIAITNFHQEMIPTDLLLAIEASRERVPFPSLVEILIMEFAFELIREAGIRIPGPIGPTLGIIGALILGQAAVAANIVSPILIIIVAVTGIGSFAIPDFSIAFSFRILRFLFIILASLAGFLGFTAGLFIYMLLLCDAKSFGVPFMAPAGPSTIGILTDSITRAPIWKQERRPDFLNTKNEMKQGNISRQWASDEKKKNRS